MRLQSHIGVIRSNKTIRTTATARLKSPKVSLKLKVGPSIVLLN